MMMMMSCSPGLSRKLGGLSGGLLLACVVACGDDEGVKSLDDVYAELAGSGATTDEDVTPSGEGNAGPASTCNLSASATSSLLFYLPLDGDTSSRAGRTSVRPGISGHELTFTESGRVGGGLVAGDGARLTLSPRLSLQDPLTVCAWVKTSSQSSETHVLVAPVPSGIVSFGISAAQDPRCTSRGHVPYVAALDGCADAELSLEAEAFTLVCWANTGGSTSISTNGRAWRSTSISVSSGAGSEISEILVAMADGGRGAIVDELTVWSRVLTEGDLSSLHASGRGCVPRASSSSSDD